jgi:hypothetical protein
MLVGSTKLAQPTRQLEFNSDPPGLHPCVVLQGIKCAPGSNAWLAAGLPYYDLQSALPSLNLPDIESALGGLASVLWTFRFQRRCNAGHDMSTAASLLVPIPYLLTCLLTCLHGQDSKADSCCTKHTNMAMSK